MFSAWTMSSTASAYSPGREPGQVERLAAGPRLPQPDDVDGLGAVSGHQHVAAARRAPSRPASSARRPSGPLGRVGRRSRPAAGRPGAGNSHGLPWKRPVVGLLDLRAVVERLLEDAELVADAVADGRDVQRGHASPAGRPPAGRGRRCPGRARRRAPRAPPATAPSDLSDRPRPSSSVSGVEQVLPQLPAEQVLRRQVVDEPGVGRIVRRRGARIPLDEPIPDGQRQGVIPVRARWPTRSSCHAGSRGWRSGPARKSSMVSSMALIFSRCRSIAPVGEMGTRCRRTEEPDPAPDG